MKYIYRIADKSATGGTDAVRGEIDYKDLSTQINSRYILQPT